MATPPHRGSGGSSGGKRQSSAEKPYIVPHTRVADEEAVRKHYDFSRSLGKGTFGVVHLVTHIESREVWACKIVNKEKAGSANVKLLEREVSILKRVHHDHIIQLREVFETSKKMYLIIEYCTAGELAALLSKKRTFTEEETRVVMSRLADAIAYLHKNDTVHRDLKLENILLTRNARDSSDEMFIKITDFGLSVQKGGSSHENMMIDMCGTPIYMAPEILHNKTYSEKCDIWAMGVIMVQLLSGSAPFNAPDQDQLYDVIMTKAKDLDKEFKSRSLWKSVSAEAKDCIRGMLTVDTAHRLTASEVLDHPWLRGPSLGAVSQSRKNVLEMMKEFNSESRGGSSDSGGKDTSKGGDPVVTCSKSSSTGGGGGGKPGASGGTGSKNKTITRNGTTSNHNNSKGQTGHANSQTATANSTTRRVRSAGSQPAQTRTQSRR